MAEQHKRKSSQKSKGLFGKVSSHRKGKMHYRKEVLDDEESLMCDDKPETGIFDIIKIRRNGKSESVCGTPKCHNGNEGHVKERSMLETGTTEARQVKQDSVEVNCQSDVEFTDKNLCESKVDITAELTPENARVVRVNAVIESDNSNGTKRPPREGFLVISPEINRSEVCLLQSEDSATPIHFDNLSISNAETSAVNGEVSEVQFNPRGEYKTQDKFYPCNSFDQEHAILLDNVGDSLGCETVPGISTPTRKNKEKTKKKKRKSNKKARNKGNFETIADEEITPHAHPTDSSDPETIEILARDPEAKTEKKKTRRKKAKRIVAKAGLTVWRGIRTGWKFMWNGLATYTLPLGSIDVTTNITKFWSANSSSSKS